MECYSVCILHASVCRPTHSRVSHPHTLQSTWCSADVTKSLKGLDLFAQVGGLLQLLTCVENCVSFFLHVCVPACIVLLSLVRECYGEGLQWAGCVLMTLLGQQKRFAALDYCYHLVRVNEVDEQEGMVQGHVSSFQVLPREGGREEANVLKCTYTVHYLSLLAMGV